MKNTFVEPKLIIVDCDGVLYHPSELDVNAMVYAFNDVCDDFGLHEEKCCHIENCTCDKPIKGFYDYIGFVAKKVGIGRDDFILKMVEHIDYSHIKADKERIIGKLEQLSHKYPLCICTNNHTAHVNQVLKAKFNLLAQELPFEIFDVRYAKKDGLYYPKESELFVAQLEKHFGVKACDFLWIDDNPKIVEKIAQYGSKAILVDEDNSLAKIITSLCETN